MNKLKLTEFELLAIGALLTLSFSLIRSHFENNKEYQCVITKVGKLSRKECTLHNSEGMIWFSGFTISKRYDIKPGDSLYKPKGSVYLYFYRRDSLTKKYLLHLTIRKP